ncbi:MAG TPA: outer membrane beta-barrel protein [Flavobacterium sp.]|nr:outer membrane beta-barrel protein [Flavobacterium sp.]
MKKFSLITLLMSLSINAQVRKKGEIEVSPFIGYSTANYYGDVGVLNEAVENPYFGINGDFYLNNRWSIRTGIEYQSMGSKGLTFFYLLEYFEEELNFVSLPIHANYHFGKKRNIYLNFGPTLTYGISYKTDDGSVNINDIRDRFYGGLGVGYKYPINETFSLAVDYQNFTRIPEFIDYGNETHYYFHGNSALNIKAIIYLGSKKEN